MNNGSTQETQSNELASLEHLFMRCSELKIPFLEIQPDEDNESYENWAHNLIKNEPTTIFGN